MGLLNQDAMNSPEMGMAMGLLSAGGASRMPVSLGQGLAQGYQGYQQAAQAEQNRQMQAMQLAQQKAQMDEMQRQKEALQQFRSQLPPPLQAQFDMDPKGFISAMRKQDEEYTLTPGAVRYKGKEKLAEAPREDSQPSAVKEYQFAVGQGYKGSFADFTRSMKQAGATTIQNYPAPIAAVNPATGQTELVQFGNKGGAKPTGFKPALDAKPPTESQANANIFASRANESHKIISDLEGKYSPLKLLAKDAAGDGIVGAGVNAMLPEGEQKAEQAQRDFLNAILRKESGALIGPTEFESGKKQYFPQPGDSKAVIEQKRKNRIMEIEGIKTAAGPVASFQVHGNNDPQQKQVVRRGKYGGKTVIQYSDGSVEYAD